MGATISSLFVDVLDIPNDFAGFVQLLFLLVSYGYILSKASNMISDGSELLLLIPALAGIVGSVVLPVLGAVPDGAIVLFSGLGPDAQEQLSVGVGALAGSTIMLLTIPWALCVLYGRVEIVGGVANYRGKGKPGRILDIATQGVTPRPSIAFNGKIMIATAISYLIIQGSAFGVNCDLQTEKGCVPQGEHWVSLVALLTCLAAFAGYMWYNVKHANDQDKEDYIAEVKIQAVESHIISLSVAFEEDLQKTFGLSSPLISNEEGERRFEAALKTFFRRYDKNGDGVIDQFELRSILSDVHENLSEEKFRALLTQMDTDGSGVIEFSEFAVAMRNFVKAKNENPDAYNARHSVAIPAEIGTSLSLQVSSDNEEATKPEPGEEEEEEDIPEDLVHLPPAQQKRRILWRATWMMGLGTLIVLLFSDPMVDVLAAIGDHLNIKPFYVAFVLAPIASNASELIASINYASKRTKKTITISLAALEGAACMNNTFCLGIFLCLIFFKQLVWEFSAETISILFVELVLFGFTFKRTHRILDALLVLSIYPVSLFVVWFFEQVVGLN